MPPVFIPGTPENDQFTKGTLDILKGLGGVWDGSDEPDNDPNTYESEHSSNRTPSNRRKHEEGQARKQRDKDGKRKISIQTGVAIRIDGARTKATEAPRTAVGLWTTAMQKTRRTKHESSI